MTSYEFPGSEPIDIFIDVAAGNVAVSAEPTEVITVDIEPTRNGSRAEQLAEDVRVGLANGRLEVIQPRNTSLLRGGSGLIVTVRAPARSACRVQTASADVSCMGEYGGLEAKTASGDITAASVGGILDANTASGDIWVDRAGSGGQVRTASGDVQIRHAGGDLSVQTASGDVSVAVATGSVHAQTASGDIQLSSVTAGEVETRTVSGDITVGVTKGTGAYLDLSTLAGRVSNQLDETGESGDVRLRVAVRTVSGAIRLIRAVAPAAGQQDTDQTAS